VLANDSTWPDVGETLTVLAVGTSAHGTASTDGTIVLYAPALNFNGTDVFTYTIRDGNGGTDSATITLTTTPVNDAPSLSTIPDQRISANTVLGPLDLTIGDVDTPIENLTLQVAHQTPPWCPLAILALVGQDLCAL
jgi:large repetitive protein